MSAPDAGAAGHVPVLLEEVLAWLAPRPGGAYVDATVGSGGHAAAILERIVPGGRLIGIDRDAEALAVAGQRLAPFATAVTLRHANYTAIRQVVAEAGLEAVDGIVMDLGASSLQFETPERGFSFTRPGPLDMRMDRTQPTRAADLVNTLPEDDLSHIIWTYGEERWARRVARRIVQRRPNLRRLPKWRRPDKPGGAPAGWSGRWSLLRRVVTLGPELSEEERAERVGRQGAAGGDIEIPLQAPVERTKLSTSVHASSPIPSSTRSRSVPSMIGAPLSSKR